ncbi:MAG: PQQ-binding-like beta-propeller repeat protein [Oscillospiraceae bacterium]|nr:PQQ-binding-like beta-propeller repeat protein [Oscillospiraceae bacterium]
MTTDSDGKADITFDEAGTWYLWSYGESGNEMDAIVNSPTYAVVNVEASSQPTPEPTPTPAPNNAPVLTENYAAGEGTATITLGEEYSINLADVFTDADGDALTYYCNDTALTETVYKVTPTQADTQTLVFKADDGKAESVTYTVTLTVNEPAKQTAKLSSLVLYRQADKKTKPLVAAEGAAFTFSPETTDYTIPQVIESKSIKIEDRNNNTLYFCAVPENENYTVTLYYPGNENGVDIKSTADVFKSYKFITAGKNDFKIVVSADDENIESTTYSFTVYAIPTLASKTTVESIYPVVLSKDLSVNTKTADITVPASLKEITVNVNPKSEGCTVTYNGETTNPVNIENKDKIEIVVTKYGVSSDTYTFNIKRKQENFVTINTVPEDAKVEVTYNNGNYVLSKTAQTLDGKYPLYFPSAAKKYTYTVTKEGYIPASGEITSTDEIINVTLTKELPPQPVEVSDVDWKNFRNSDENMAITSIKTPTEKVALKWSTKLGENWGNAPSVAIIVDNNIITMSGSILYKLDPHTGEVVDTAQMVSTPNWGYTPPTYANGMIFCPLNNGVVQAFNATTFESLWVFKDLKGGQANSPVTYSDGHIYTGFWNGESGDANFVCIDVTDYDADQKDEPKTAVWSLTHNGGFYWAGAVVVGDAVIVGTDDGDAEGSDAGSSLYSFNKKTGEVITKLALASDAGDQRSSIAYDKENGKIYFTTKGGYLYSAKVNSDGTITALKGVNYDAQLTSTPIVYKGKAYFGIGSGIRTDGSEGSFVVADADTLKEILRVELKGYPQGSALLSTAYEAEGYLYFYMTYNDKPGGISMVKVKTDAQTASDAQLIEIYDAAGFEQFCIASIICGDDGTLYYKNDSGNFFAVAPATYKTVIELIDKIGTVTLESESAIKAAREAYEELEESEKAKVTNLDVLIAAEKELENFITADKVDKLISDIGYVTLNNGKRVKEAREAYDKLTDYQKTLVENYDRLVELEKEYNKLADEAVSKVEKLIDKIGEVDIDSAEDIADAKLAYNQLPDELKELVENYKKLEKAEKELKKLREEALALLAEGKLVLTKTELLELKEDFEKVTENTSYDAVLALLRTFHKLGEKQQLALENSDEVKLAQKIVAKHNHNNAYTGVKVDGLEWNIRLVVEETDDETALNSIKAKLENNEILTIWDIYLEDVLTGKKYKPEDTLKLKIPTNLMGDYTAYDHLKVIHYTDDGRIELLNCEVEDGYVVFSAAEFSWYGVVGFMNETEETIGDNLTLDVPVTVTPQVDIPQNNSSPILWVIIAAVGVAALAVLAVMKKRTKDEE